MENEELENSNSENAENENANSENSNDTSETTETEDVEALKEKNRQLFERAKKAEGFIKDDTGKWIKKLQPVKTEIKLEAKKEEHTSFSLGDVYALNNAKVAEEDVPEVAEYAKFKNITIAEALKTGVIKTLLAEKVEQRKTAETTNVRNTGRGSTKATGEELLERAQAGGEITSDEDFKKIAIARMQAKKNQNKK